MKSFCLAENFDFNSKALDWCNPRDRICFSCVSDSPLLLPNDNNIITYCWFDAKEIEINAQKVEAIILLLRSNFLPVLLLPLVVHFGWLVMAVVDASGGGGLLYVPINWWAINFPKPHCEVTANKSSLLEGSGRKNSKKVATAIKTETKKRLTNVHWSCLPINSDSISIFMRIKINYLFYDFRILMLKGAGMSMAEARRSLSVSGTK